MPMLFALGQHQALRSVQHFLHSDEHQTLTTLTSFVLPNVWASFMYGSRWICGSFLGSKSIWARPGLEHRRALSSRMQTVCRDGGLEVQGLRVLGIHIGNPVFVRSELRKKFVLHSVLLDRTPVVEDLQSSCSCCTAPTLGPIIGSVMSHHRMLHSSLLTMMLQRSRASLGSLAQISPRMHRILPHCFCPLEVVGFEAPPGRRKPHIGPVGRTASG